MSAVTRLPGRKRSAHSRPRALRLEPLERRVLLSGDPILAHWIGGSGDWWDPAHWDIGEVPHNTADTTYAVVLDLPGSDPTITVDHSATVSTLAVNEALHVAAGATLDVDGALTLQADGVLTARPAAEVAVAGDLVGDTTRVHGRLPVTLWLDGAAAPTEPELLEAMSQDLGAHASAYDQVYVYHELLVCADAQVRLVDQADNAAGGGAEAVYAYFLEVAGGATLDLGGLSLYAQAVEIEGTVTNGTIRLVPNPADGLFYQRDDFPAGEGPLSVAVGDFDGDGREDLAVANWYSDDVSLLLGRGDGTFAPQLRYGAGQSPVSVAVGDFDGDGCQDLAVANANSGDVSVLLGRGDGTFDPQARYDAGIGPWSVAVGDFDGNGWQDLAIANRVTDDVRVLLGLGDGTFAPQARYAVGDEPFSVAVGDFDNDGRQDVAVANLGGDDVSVLLGHGDGSFAQEARYGADAGGWLDGPCSVAVGDFEGDGHQDLAVASYYSDGVSVLRGRGDGSFAWQAWCATGDAPRWVGVADFDGDGREDLAVASQRRSQGNPGVGGLHLLLGSGDGTFAGRTSYETGPDSYLAAAGDFDGDGRQDVAVANLGGDDVSVLLGQGDGTFARQALYHTGWAPVSVAVGEFNGDGCQDLAVTSPVTIPGLWLFLGRGGGTFAEWERYDFSGPADPYSVAVGDFNEDGHRDLAVATEWRYFSGTGSVRVLSGQGDGTFAVLRGFGVGYEPRSLGVGDFDDDGHQDLAVANRGPSDGTSLGDLSVLLGRGDGTFAPEVRYGAGEHPCCVAVGDFDADGAQDLAAANSDSDDVSVLLGRGDGTFAPEVRYGAGDYPYCVGVGDFDGDGAQDLAVANYDSDDVSVLLSQGDGTFAPQEYYEADFEPRSVAAGDFDGDGRQDLAVAVDGGVDVLLGNGDGTFGPAGRYHVSVGTNALAVAELTADGLPDVVATSRHGYAVAVLLRAEAALAPPGLLVIDTTVMQGGRLVLNAPGPTSLGVLEIGLNGNPADVLMAIRIGSDESPRWLRFVPSGARTDIFADGEEAEWHTAAEWVGKRLRGLEPATAYGFYAKAADGEGAETDLVEVCVFETSADGDVNRSGLATALDYAYIKKALLEGSAIGDEQSWACDVTGDAEVNSLDLAAARYRILNPVAGGAGGQALGSPGRPAQDAAAGSPQAASATPTPVAAVESRGDALDLLALRLAYYRYPGAVSRFSVFDRDQDGDVDRHDITGSQRTRADGSMG